MAYYAEVTGIAQMGNTCRIYWTMFSDNQIGTREDGTPIYDQQGYWFDVSISDGLTMAEVRDEIRKKINNRMKPAVDDANKIYQHLDDLKTRFIGLRYPVV